MNDKCRSTHGEVPTSVAAAYLAKRPASLVTPERPLEKKATGFGSLPVLHRPRRSRFGREICHSVGNLCAVYARSEMFH